MYLTPVIRNPPVLFKQNGLPSLNTWKCDLKATEECNILGVNNLF